MYCEYLFIPRGRTGIWFGCEQTEIFVTVFFSESYYVEEGYEKVAVFDQYLALSRKQHSGCCLINWTCLTQCSLITYLKFTDWLS